MVHIEVSPNESRILQRVDCVLLREQAQLASSTGICDICWYLGDSKPKQVKTVYEVIACKACYIGMKEMNR